ncbi:hypothetical protein PISMIDRAFT_324022 [Pisolithus microcarpus 441]|uniref:Transmembrane protein n=1 Tax=Pisolithus microcarpus 441 TaxID=765257 RepID=A0A0D0A0Z6_9AGAM|nr:hypothetical protein BKA83DRAFT_324022 [Pisolithus microcarpus]KIK25783.1 hypothetical protein PISMIDRAFT_324022 [Pisolithus microcarpus 441]
MLGGDRHYRCGDIPNFVDEGAFRQFREYPITEGAYSFDFFSYIFPTLPFTGSSSFMMSRAAVVLRHLCLLPPPVGAFDLVLLVRNRGRLSSQVTRGCRESILPTRGFLIFYCFYYLFFFFCSFTLQLTSCFEFRHVRWLK